MADWHAQLNNKMGGDLKKIQTVGEYMVEIWRAAGMEGIGTKVSMKSFPCAGLCQTCAAPCLQHVLHGSALRELEHSNAQMQKTDPDSMSVHMLIFVRTWGMRASEHSLSCPGSCRYEGTFGNCAGSVPICISRDQCAAGCVLAVGHGHSSEKQSQAYPPLLHHHGPQ